MRAAIHTLGCKVNFCDTENLAARLGKLGFSICGTGELADLYVVNTCTVTSQSDKKSMQAIRRARKNSKAVVAVCGCMAKRAADLPADFVFDARIPGDFEGKLRQTRAWNCEPEPVDNPPARTRAFVKIQDGCSRFCSYCVVPYVRGPATSRRKDEVLAEIESLLAAGCKEIVLSGTNLAAYSDGGGFAALLESALSIEGLGRLRLSSIDPSAVDGAFLDVVARHGNLCPHFHLPLQSGSNRILGQMKRKYTAEGFMSAVERIRQIRPCAALTTDAIVGFPGETDECFARTYSLSEAAGFSGMHVFEYSKRDGTEAALFEGQVRPSVKKERSRKLRELARRMGDSYMEAQVGRTLEVLFEGQSEPGVFLGFSREYVRVRAKSGEPLFGALRDVKITEIAKDRLFGKILDVQPAILAQERGSA